jgi:pimeloyl-ACP methyl ester carboxylesterase
MQPVAHALRYLTPLIAAVLLCQCTAPISVRTVKPPPPAGISGTSTSAALLASIRAASTRIAGGDESAVAIYNHQVARLLEHLEKSGADPWSAPLSLADSSGNVTLRGMSPPDVAAAKVRLIPTDTLRFKGEYGEIRSTVEGIGAPLVAVTSFETIGHTRIRKNLPVRNLTAVVRFTGSTAALELVDPYQVETIPFAGRSRPLAADYGAAVMLALSKSRIDKLGLVRLLRPSRYDNTAHLNFTQPYDPKRIPVLMVHGLDSTPATFAPMYFHLLEDPEIRRNYQFWVFSYPSGYPYHYSAALLRRELDSVQHDFPGHRGIVIIGHSMGGIISRLMLTDAGDRLWIKAFGKPPAKTSATGLSRKLLEEILIFSDRREIDRAIFFSAPHRGSGLAVNPIGSLFARLVRMPGTLADVRNVALSLATADQAGLMIQAAPNSIGTLSPRNPFVLAVNEIPVTPRVPHHSVVGDRGKGDTPQSSDGVVPYWSSHMKAAASEKIVPSGHGSHAHPQGIEEAQRILKLHLKSR